MAVYMKMEHVRSCFSLSTVESWVEEERKVTVKDYEVWLIN